MQQRHCLILQGESDWLEQQAETLFQQQTAGQRIWLKAAPSNQPDCITAKQYTSFLGRECGLVIIDASSVFPVDACAALMGCIVAGGRLVLLLNQVPAGAWLQRFLRIAQHYPVQWCQQPASFPPLTPITISTQTRLTPTAEQQQVIAAVFRVVEGHRRRPLVISADRGRGKSTLLGMAAAALLQTGKQRILITAPQFASVASLFTAAKQALAGAEISAQTLYWGEKTLQFMAPDSLLQQQPPADLLIVDEAAAIPVSLLTPMLATYSRLVFATTLHGYEGTGRGFALRFQQLLTQQAPGWRAEYLHSPVRWAEDDWLEAFFYRAFLLHAEAASSESLSACRNEPRQFAWIDKSQLLADEASLEQIFGLMVLAHYRTRPSDLQMMLEHDNVRIAVLTQGNVIVATVWLVAEPGLDDSLAQAVFNGQRRQQGQLLPQSLLVHCGIADAGRCRYQRVIRIAVHPDLQRQGIGSELLAAVTADLRAQNDVIGSSFALHETVLPFWLNNGFIPIRLGYHRDEVSASRSVLMLQSLSKRGDALVSQAKHRFAIQWPLALLRYYNDLPVTLVCQLSASLYQAQEIETSDEVRAFAWQQRPYESCEMALFSWLSGRLGSPRFLQLKAEQQALLIYCVMQNMTFPEVAKLTGLSGRAQIIANLRSAVATYLQWE